jgi:hypothetical protein
VTELSIRGRLAVALHLFADYCERRGLDHPAIPAFADYLWRFIGLQNPEAFGIWESERPPLVDAGLGWEYPPGFEELLASRGVPEREFRSTLCHTTEVLYGSMYGAADAHGSLQNLGKLADTVTQFGVSWPDVQRFAGSRWSDRWGWGEPLSPEDLAGWRERRPG